MNEISLKSGNQDVENTLFIGLAGVGKSHSIYNLITEITDTGSVNSDTIFYFSFNKYLQIEAIKSINLPANHITTLHAFCFRILEILNKLPTAFNNSITRGGYIETPDSPIKSKDFDRLITGMIRLSDKKIRSVVPSISILIVDEYQDWREDYVTLLKKLIRIYQCKVIIGYGLCQNIYRFQNTLSSLKIKDNLKNIESDLGLESIRRVDLIENHRTKNIAILRAAASFIQKHYPRSIREYVDEGIQGDLKYKYSKPVLRFFSSQRDEMLYVLNQIKGIPDGKRIAILSQYKRDLLIYKNRLQAIDEKNYRLDISTKRMPIILTTAYQFKGLEADYIFYIGFDLPENAEPDQYDLVYTTMTRAKEKLFITTSYPKKRLHDVFRLGDFEYRDSQRPAKKPYGKLPNVQQNRNYSYKKLIKSSIDSISLKVKMVDAPFCPYVKNGGTRLKQNIFEKKQTDTFCGIPITITYHNVHKIYYFEFFDLSLLKKNGYRDRQILLCCYNYILSYFDNRISSEAISVHRIDLAILLKAADADEFQTFLSFIPYYFRGSDAKSVRDKNGTDYLKVPIEGFDFRESALYANHYTGKGYGITTKAYLPSEKSNGNVIHIQKMLKLEMRIQGDVINRQFVLGENNMLAYLLREAKHGSLKSLFVSLFRRYHQDVSRIIDEYARKYDLEGVKKLGVFHEIEKILNGTDE